MRVFAGVLRSADCSTKFPQANLNNAAGMAEVILLNINMPVYD